MREHGRLTSHVVLPRHVVERYLKQGGAELIGQGSLGAESVLTACPHREPRSSGRVVGPVNTQLLADGRETFVPVPSDAT
jgi:hypothetical protein